MEANQTVDSLFAMLATLLHFGQRMSNVASLYTSAHGRVLAILSVHVTSVMEVLSQNLFASIASTVQHKGFVFADEDRMTAVVAQTRGFMRNCTAYSLLEDIAQVIVVQTCKGCDEKIFNVILETSSEFTDQKVTQILHSIRRPQSAFNCFSRNFGVAFPNLIDLITTSKQLWSGMQHITKRTKLLRTIVERCRPAIVLPEGVAIDDIGQHCNCTCELYVADPKFSFVFSFEWLWLRIVNRNGKPGRLSTAQVNLYKFAEVACWFTPGLKYVPVH
jgi:hypothetical protein